MNSIFLPLADFYVQFLLAPPYPVPPLSFPPTHLLLILEYRLFGRLFLIVFIYHLFLNTSHIFHWGFFKSLWRYVFLNWVLVLVGIGFLGVGLRVGHGGDLPVAKEGEGEGGEEFELGEVGEGVHGNNFNMKKGMSNKEEK